jgi:N-hydroxyarylamine O-acetyltransferase
MDTEAYLERIHYHGSLNPRAETLRQLHLAHLLAVPFENLSIHWGEPIVLEDEALFEKIVARRRGGFCYELNGLFAALLRELGFQVTMLSAAVYGQAGYGPAFDHMALMVTLEDRWLADVGFGDSFCEPLLLDCRGEQVQGERAYRLDEEDGRFFMWQREGEGAWEAQYRFSLMPYRYGDYAAMCHYHQTSAESHFTQRRVCSRATADGRVTLSGQRLIMTENGRRQERELEDEIAYLAALQTYFGIEMAEPCKRMIHGRFFL